MRYLELEGARLSVIGLGTWQFGSREWGYGRAYARETAAQIVDRALDLGVSSVAQVEENAAAADLSLTDTDVLELEAAADRFSRAR
jgi:aryl-alcohol dehydrogenase-like predicted oxidoreductase